VHANRYYQLEVSYFKSQLDSNLLELLWSKYWVNTLASNSLSATKSYMTSSLRDLSSKIDGAESSVAHGGRLAYFSGKKKEETQLSKVAKVGARVG
jgi:COP9 signalosome complex subunit 5